MREGGYLAWVCLRKVFFIGKGACGQSSRIVEDNRQNNRLEDGS